MIGAILLAPGCTFPNYDLRDGANDVAGGGGAAGSASGAAFAGVGAIAGIGGSIGLGGSLGTSGPHDVGGTGGAAGSDGDRAPPSCFSALTANPKAASGPYLIDPDGADSEPPFMTYCDMVTQGGGWTLLASLTPGAGLKVDGLPADPCYDHACVNRAYSALAIANDLRFDGASVAIADEAYDVMIVANEVSAAVRGKTLRALFSAPMAAFVQEQGGPRLVVEFKNGASCKTWGDLGGVLCSTSLIVLQDPSGCGSNDVFAVGSSYSYDKTIDTCSGWPQKPAMDFPVAFRFWSR